MFATVYFSCLTAEELLCISARGDARPKPAMFNEFRPSSEVRFLQQICAGIVVHEALIFELSASILYPDHSQTGTPFTWVPVLRKHSFVYAGSMENVTLVLDLLASVFQLDYPRRIALHLGVRCLRKK